MLVDLLIIHSKNRARERESERKKDAWQECGACFTSHRITASGSLKNPPVALIIATRGLPLLPAERCRVKSLQGIALSHDRAALHNENELLFLFEVFITFIDHLFSTIPLWSRVL